MSLNLKDNTKNIFFEICKILNKNLDKTIIIIRKNDIMFSFSHPLNEHAFIYNNNHIFKLI